MPKHRFPELPDLPDAEDWDELPTPDEAEWDEIEGDLPRCDLCKMECHPNEMTGALCFECLAIVEEEGLTDA